MRKILLILTLCVSFIFAQEKTQNLYYSTIEGKKLTIELSKQSFKFKDFPNKTILLNFFGKKCPPCLMEMPHLIKLQKKYKKNFEIVAIEVQTKNTIEQLKAFVKEKGINYTVSDYDHAQDIVSFISYVMKWQGQIPFMLLIDKDGKLLQQYLGMVDPRKIEEDIKKSIEGK